MAGIIDWLTGSAQENTDLAIRNRELHDENAKLQNEVMEHEERIEEVEESLLQLADAFDNIGWSKMGFDKPDELKQMPLATVKKIAALSQALAAANPFVERAVSARIGYIWGNGVEFDKHDDNTQKAMKANRRTVFGAQAYEERERALATDGNLFLALNREYETDTFRIPLYQITGAISNPDNPEEIWYYKRTWTRTAKNGDTEAVNEKDITRYYPSIHYIQKLENEGRDVPKRWGKWGVDQKYVIQHTAVNKQIGWRWGLPDIMTVMFFAKVYKEYLEDNASLVKAYSKIAWQVKNTNLGAANQTAASFSNMPTRDSLTGEVTNIAGVANTGFSTEMEAHGLNAGQVKFDNGKPMLVAIAAGMELSLSDIAPEEVISSGISQTTLKAMENRQKLWSEAFTEIFEFWGDDDVEIKWRNIDEDETHRRSQSVALGVEKGLLHREEGRKEFLEMLRIVPEKDTLPPDPAELAAERAVEQAQVKQASAVPGQGQSGSVGSVNSGAGQVKQAVKKSMNY